MVVVLVVVVLFEVLTSDQDVPLALSVPVGLAMTVPLVWGQRHPLVVGAVVLGANLVQTYAGDWELDPQSELLPICVVFWTFGAYTPVRTSRWALGAGLLALFAYAPDDVIVLGPLMVGVFAAGRLMRSRDDLAEALREERAHAERYAVAEERARIARELHDVVGHAVAMMTVQAGAERLVLGDARPETSQVLEQIESTGRQTLQEMRTLLGVLHAREGEPDLAPQPGLDELPGLAERMGRAGLRVALEVDGEVRGVSPGVDISAYRVVQEGLTNVLKHAGSDQALVRVVHERGAVTVEVSDDGPGPSEPGAPGHGLAGMAERVAVYGGTLAAGPGPERGWRLVARLPREPAS